jgi:hypothetical protein
MAVNINIPTQVSQTITNGVTAFAPSEDAVFDALALKQDILTNPVTGTGANGQVSFWTGTGSQSGDNELFWDNTNKRLGVGTNTPIADIEIVRSTTDGTGNPLFTTLYSGTSAAASGGFIGRKARGSQANPSQIITGDSIAGFFGSGYHSGGAFGANAVAIRFNAAENYTSTSQGTLIDFATTAIGSTARTVKMQLLGNGNVIIQNGGTFTDAGFRLDVNGTARVQGNFTLTAGANIVLQTTTGTRIGTATNQRLSLWNATPDVQPTTAITAAAFVANTSGIVDDTATFGGYTMGQVVAALKRIGALA